MDGVSAETFARFLRDHDDELKRIARASRSEWSTDDVRNEAYVLASGIGSKLGRSLDLAEAEDALLLIRWLYNHCVKYTETVVRYATRLDHSDSDDERDHHWLQDRLAADDGADPLSLLVAGEVAAPEPDDPDPYHSPAAAMISLFQRFDQRMTDVAAFLLISVSWCYACCRQARAQASTQRPLPHELVVGTDAEALRPWRRYKLPARTPARDSGQLCFDYWRRPPQPVSGQLWLL